MLPWPEKVPTLSIHPDAASRDDIARLATELMEANKQLDNARDCLWSKKAGYVKGLEDENKAILRRAEAAEEDWQLANKRIKQLEGEEPIPFSWWSECPKLAQKVMERIMKRKDELEAALQGMVPFIEDDFPNGTGKNHGTCATDKYQEACNVVMQALKES